MSARSFASRSADKSLFVNVDNYLAFAGDYLTFLDEGLQATIVAQNEHSYSFFQYKEDAGYAVSRPVNTDLFMRSSHWASEVLVFRQAMKMVMAGGAPEEAHRKAMRRVIYTMQQAIGCSLDALPVGESNRARKINGDLFERLMQLLLTEAGFDCTSGVTRVPVRDSEGSELFKANYQHDLLVAAGGDLKIVGSVKTSSKDRIDKIFIDKFLYGQLTDTDVPHVAIFLNDVQRKGKDPRSYGVSGTFLPGHFKAYTVKLNPLDGVYYCDIRPSMRVDPLLAQHIDTIDRFFFDDLRPLLARGGEPLSEVEILTD